MQIVAAWLSWAEPPLRREAVDYILDVDIHMFSLRRSKASFHGMMSLLSGVAAVYKWSNDICQWKNPKTTCLVHVLFLILVCYPELLGLREAGIHDEEFDTFPTSKTKPADLVRFRYDRLRSVAGRVQSVIGDIASHGERALVILSWRDSRATVIFIMFALIWAVTIYVTPIQVIVVLLGLYVLRHPRFRGKLPSVPVSFFKRLPAKSDKLL